MSIEVKESNGNTITGSVTDDRDLYSVYVNYNQKFDKLTMQLGTRLEDYEVNGVFEQSGEEAVYTDKIFSIYPSAFFTYNSSEKIQYN